MADLEQVVEKMRELQAMGVRCVLEPDAVMVRVGTLEIACPYEAGTLRTQSARHTTIAIDGHRIEHRLTSVDLRIAVNEVIRAAITFELIP
jgi:hypothetical protein